MIPEAENQPDRNGPEKRDGRTLSRQRPTFRKRHGL